MKSGSSVKKGQRIKAPQARADHLPVQELDDELLIYDLDQHKAHCLNLTAALIWIRCDGKTSARDMAQALKKELDTSVDEDIIRQGIKQLEQAHLLVNGKNQTLRASRRNMMRKAGSLATVALPLIISIVAPESVEAGSCVALGGNGCSTSRPCCAGVCLAGRCV
jgi:hypothetical protein